MPKFISKTRRGLSPDEKLEAILNDRTSGATIIERNIYAWLILLLSQSKTQSSRSIKKSVFNLRNRFGNMANVLGLLSYFENLLANSTQDQMLMSLKNYRHRIDHNRELTITTTAKKIKRYGSIFALSNSSIITGAVLLARKQGWKGTVNLTESRPKCEAAIPARKFAKAGLKVNYGVDSMMPKLIRQSGAIFLGADAVTQSYFINKIGTQVALDYGEKLRKPLFVAADKSKFISNRNFKFTPETNPTDEILQYKHKNLLIINHYFEKVVPYGRMKFICGEDIMNPADVKNLLKLRF